MNFITVYENEGCDAVEIPQEEDETVLLTTLLGQFPKVSGLKYRYSGSANFRAVKLSEGKLFKPVEGWNKFKFICVFPKEVDNKRKCVEQYEISTPKTKRLEGKKCTDLIVLNLGWKVDEDVLKKYFCKFGELVFVQVKKDRETSHSKGFAFVRFADYESQVLCLAEKHLIDGRWCAVKVPFSKSEADKQEISKKIHISYNSEDIKMEDLRKTFEEYGYVMDIYIPKPFRNFAFLTFESSDVAQQLVGRTLTLKGYSLVIGSAVPKIIVNKKPIQAQYPMYTAYNDQAYPTRYGWSSYEQAIPVNYKSRQDRQQPTLNNYPSLVQNSSYLLTNGGTQTGLVSIDYSNQSNDMGNNTAAMAALNILNNPDVIAAIVSAATKNNTTATAHNNINIYPHQHSSM